MQRSQDGEVVVVHADPVIRVAREVLNLAEAWDADNEVLTLDTAGEYRYHYLRPDPGNRRALIFGRIVA